MKNLSLNKEPLQLKIDTQYLVIDGLYLNDIKSSMGNLKSQNLINEIRKEVFPYTYTPFAEYLANEETFLIDQIKKVDYQEDIQGDSSFFSTDTGLIIFIDKKLLFDFLGEYDYYDLVDSLEDVVNRSYWGRIVSKYHSWQIALVVAPGINSGVDFNGSGTYQI